ncbi:MAG: DNA-binding protein [Butyrivibrio sp.]
MNYVTTIEMSEIWGISARRIALLCEQERIEGAIKKGKTWLIPENAEKPADKRKNVKKEDVTYVQHQQ